MLDGIIYGLRKMFSKYKRCAHTDFPVRGSRPLKPVTPCTANHNSKFPLFHLLSCSTVLEEL